MLAKAATEDGIPITRAGTPCKRCKKDQLCHIHDPDALNPVGRGKGRNHSRLHLRVTSATATKLQRESAQQMMPLSRFVDEILVPAYFELEETQRLQGLEIEGLKQAVRDGHKEILRLTRKVATLQTQLSMPRRRPTAGGFV